MPLTIRWKHVISLLEKPTTFEEIAEASVRAVDTGLAKVPSDHGFLLTLHTAFQVADAFQSKDSKSALRERGFKLTDDPTLLDYTIAFRERAETAVADLKTKSDLPEIARDSFSEVVVGRVAPLLPSLFGTTPGEVESAIRGQLKGVALRGTMHEFFVNFTRRYLDYYLSRELGDHVGIGRSLGRSENVREFETALESYIRQSVRITDEFTPGWFGKARYEGRLTVDEVSKYAHVAFKKIREEFKRGAESRE